MPEQWVGEDGPELFIPHPIPPKRRARYRLTKWSLPWLIGIALFVPYEILMIVQGHAGGPLTHVVKWAYGDPQSLRWWVIGFAHSGFLLWMVPHFLFEGWGLKQLLTLVIGGALLGLVGYLVTR